MAHPDLRDAITAATRPPEPDCLPALIDAARLPAADALAAQEFARGLVTALRARQGARRSVGVEGLLQEFSLSSQEGVALMCLAEALLRIPDAATRDALIRDKIGPGDWRAHLGHSPSLFVNAAAWGLMLTGRLVATRSEKTLEAALARLVAKGGEPLIRKAVDAAMRMMGEQFVAGETIGDAIARGRRREARGFRHSYDMLGEAAATADDAARYLAMYEGAIRAIAREAGGRGAQAGPGISIKLSALHPRYCRAQRARVMAELLPRLRGLALLARDGGVGLNIDAEESERLELSLDLLEALCLDDALRGWDGIGFVVQAYQKRCPHVIDWLVDLARRTGHRLMVRLVKGAYWDSEIKRAQVEGLEGFPVYTRKVHTDVAYLACARRMLAAPAEIYPQFATHNAATLAAVRQMAGLPFAEGRYEFQCLHGMGEPLYEAFAAACAAQGVPAAPCRIYAPVGTHETLLAYLVRRLLENGANTSFVHRIADAAVPVDALVADPVAQAARIEPPGAPHPRIALPRDLYRGAGGGRANSRGMDLCSEPRIAALQALLAGSPALAAPPPDLTAADVARCAAASAQAAAAWRQTPVAQRAACLERTAGQLEDAMHEAIVLLVREAGKTLPSAVAEVREAIDFLRYDAQQAREALGPAPHRALGPVACISPWNFPLAIFTGQVAAALAAGNTVLAKPAEQTPRIAQWAVRQLHAAGIPAEALQLLPGPGGVVGAALVADARVQGVMFTGSTDVARGIAQALARRLDADGRPVTLVAETGGQNAMVVDSSALAEQVVADVLQSAFDSAGQRCSALRVLCLQEDIADRTLRMLEGAMRELQVGDPALLSTDVGPVIDAPAKAMLDAHIAAMRAAGCRVVQAALPAGCAAGAFVAPALIEIDGLHRLKGEVFGPVLHVMRWRRGGLDALLDAIHATGYGLTFGLQTRIDETIAQCVDRCRAGNVYVNRNMVRAVVGVQPFGGEGLSGTGPKAGGPLYLHRLLAEGPPPRLAPGEPLELPGPTGERNTWRVLPRGTVLCVATTAAGARAQQEAVARTGNRAVIAGSPEAALQAARHDAIDAVLFEGGGEALRRLNEALAQREGPLVQAQALRSDELAAGAGYAPGPLVRERSLSVNTAAAGGNASLMMLD